MSPCPFCLTTFFFPLPPGTVVGREISSVPDPEAFRPLEPESEHGSFLVSRTRCRTARRGDNDVCQAVRLEKRKIKIETRKRLLCTFEGGNVEKVRGKKRQKKQYKQIKHSRPTCVSASNLDWWQFLLIFSYSH